MYENPGHAYVYRIYGMYWCLNAVTEPAGTPCAVLIRAVEPISGLADATDGPGKLCRAYGIDSRYNRADLTAGPLYIARGDGPSGAVTVTPRIGVAYAGAWAEEPLRFTDSSSRFVSRRPARRT
jgi:DNA-3-methyladenine glycosylase